jgi:hypothetical protein
LLLLLLLPLPRSIGIMDCDCLEEKVDCVEDKALEIRLKLIIAAAAAVL